MSRGDTGAPAAASAWAISAEGRIASLRAVRISGHSFASLALRAAVPGPSIAFWEKAAQQEAPSSGPKWRSSSALVRRVGDRTGASPAVMASCRRAMEGLGPGRIAHHVDVMADEMLALAGGIAAPAEGHAEARQDQGARQKLDGTGIAVRQRASACQQPRLIRLQQQKR